MDFGEIRLKLCISTKCYMRNRSCDMNIVITKPWRINTVSEYVGIFLKSCMECGPVVTRM